MTKETVSIKDERNNSIYYVDRHKYNEIQNILLKENIIEDLYNLKDNNYNRLSIIRSKIEILKKIMLLLPILIFSLTFIINISLLFIILISSIISILSELKITGKIKKYTQELENLNIEVKCINKQINSEIKNIQIKNEKILQKVNFDKSINEQKKSLQELEALIIYNKNKEDYYYYFKINKLKEHLNSIYTSEVADIIYKMIKEDFKNKCKKKVM